MPDELAADRDLLTRIQAALTTYLDRRRAEAGELDAPFGEAVDMLSAFVLDGGKRVRPTFAWWGWRAAGGEPIPTDPTCAGTSSVVHAVAALELLQACALLHDDLIDDSATRRGRPTAHVSLAATHRDSGWSGRPESFGMAGALLLGDLALAWADDMLWEAGLPPAALRRALEPWRAVRTEVLAGQYLDVRAQASRDETPAAAGRIAALKTASYTVERPLHLGAAIAGASEEVTAALRRFGADIGTAFQLRDDLLGVFGDPEVTGKPAGDDLREGKRTLVVALALENAAADPGPEFTRAAKVLRKALGDAELDTAGVDEAREALTRLGAVDAVERRIEELTTTASQALESVELTEPGATRLNELAVTATQRSR